MYQIVNYYHENFHKISDFKLQSRFLWNDHIIYTRNVIISILANLSDIDTISQRLLKNQEDIGSFISPYYSTEQVDIFVNLLKQHIVIAVDVINGIVGAEDQWRINGNHIVEYMYQMNRMYWPTSITSPMWTQHLNLTIGQINARNNFMWDEDIVSYDDNHICMSKFSDLFSNGIIYQNIDQFCTFMTGN